MSPEHISVDIQKFEFNLGSNWKNSVTRSIEIWQPNFGYFQYWLVKIYDIDDNNSLPAFVMIGWIGCGVLEELIEKNVSHSKMVIHITDISSLEGAKMRYKFNKYPKGF